MTNTEAWKVFFHPEFYREYEAYSEEVQDAIEARIDLLKELGPGLGRPYVDTLKASRYANMKELRFDALGGTWRVAFAFDPKRNAILLTAGNKSMLNQKRFYGDLIRTADRRFAQHLETQDR